MVAFGNEEPSCKQCQHLKPNGTCLQFAGIPNAQKCGKHSVKQIQPDNDAHLLSQEIDRRARQIEEDFDFELADIKRAILSAVKNDRLSRTNPRTAIRFVRSLGASGVEVVCSDCGSEMSVDQLYNLNCPEKSCRGKMILSSLL